MVENTKGTSGFSESNDYEDRVQWQDTIHLLRLVQSDYQGVTSQLEKVTHALREKEAVVNQRLQYALLASGSYRTLCLVAYGAGITGNQMGRVVLGRIARPSVLPGLMRLEVRCLGRFGLRSEWKQVERWQSVKAKSVFQYLMTRPRESVIKDVLMETLWPDCDPGSR